MKKIIIYLFTLSILSLSCAPKLYDTNVQNSILNKKEKKFIEKFEYTVQHHQEKKFMKYLDKKYKKEQFYDLYKANLKSFLADFFCGTGKDKKFYCLNFFDIESIKVYKIEPYEQNQKKIIFKITGKDKTFYTDLILNNQKRLGFIGSYG
jgi:hypothetical protein